MTFNTTGERRRYRANGKQVSGVTTILGNFTNPGGLVHWAFKTGQENPDWPNPYQKSDDAKDAGTVAHEMVELWVQEKDPNDALRFLDNRPDVQKNALNAFEMFQEWYDQSGIRIVATEVQLSSEKYNYGGTIDAIGMDQNDKVQLLDWKTSNSIYPDHVVQVAAYGDLWEENGNAPIDSYHVLQFHKEYADFKHYRWGELDDAKELFHHLAEAHQLQKLVKKRI